MSQAQSASSTDDHGLDVRQSAGDAPVMTGVWYSALFDQSPNGILLIDTQTGAILAANPEACRLLGYTEQELRTMNRTAVVDTTDPQLAVAVEMRDRAGHFRGELTYRRADGTLFPVEVTSSIFTGPDGRRIAGAFFADISERKATEQALRESEEKWRGVFEFLPVGVSIVSTKHNVTDTNPALAQILGFTEDGILKGAYTGRRYFRSDHSLMPPAEFPSLRALKEQRTIRNVEIGVEKEDGTIIWTSVSATPLSLSGYSATVTVDITERKRAEAALHASEERLRFALDATNEGLWDWDIVTGAVVGNDQWFTLFGYAPGEVSPTIDLWQDTLYPDDVVETYRVLDDYLEGRSPTYASEHRVITKSGEIRWHLSVGKAVAWDADGKPVRMVGTNTDITERLQAEVQVREALERLRLATDAADIGIWNWNFADDRLEWDDRMCEFYAVSKAERAGGLYYDVWRSRVHPDDLAQNEASLGMARRTGAEWESTFRIVLPDGGIRHIHAASVVEYDRKGEPLRMIGINRDVTVQKTYERLLQDANAELEQRVAARTAELQATVVELNHANAGKDAFLAAVSHELRTPLTGILGMSEALQAQIKGPLNPQQERYVGLIQTSGERLLALVNNILRYTKLMNSKTPVQREACHLLDLCTSGVRAVRAKSELKRQNITLDVTPVDLTIESDPDSIVSIVTMLLDNAIKFTPEQGSAGVQVSRVDGEDAVRLMVWDTGVGISDEQLPYLFQPFAQGDQMLARRFGGVGLGLVSVHKLVELLGGKIAVESELEKGSQFIVTLPA